MDGWNSIRPPADPRLSRSTLASAIARYLDAIDLWWSEEVINYDLWRQFGLFSKTAARLVADYGGLEGIRTWGRSFDEYRRMFDLTDDALRLRIVGCADGPASFNAEMNRRGRRVVSVDPLYQFSAEQISRRITEVFDGMISRGQRQGPCVRVASHPLARAPRADPDGRDERVPSRLPARLKEGRYLPASLPTLPFRDRAFDLALCSHYLYTIHF
jgi:hypothetical protein